MTQLTSIICQHCHKGIRNHHGKEAGIFELSPGPNGLPVRRGWHVKKCWAIERNRRKREQKEKEKPRQRQTLADLEAEVAFKINRELDKKIMPTEKPPEPPAPTEMIRSTAFAGQRGLGEAIYKIIDAYDIGQEWSTVEVTAQLEKAGFKTTAGTITQYVYTYRKHRRPATLVRRETVGTGSRKIWRFDIAAPAEPPSIVTVPNQKRKTAPDRYAGSHQFMADRASPVVEAAVEAIKEELPKHPEVAADIKRWQTEAEMRTPRPSPKPAPTPGLSRAEINRAFNDFQQFMLEALQDFRNELLKKVP